MSSVRNCRKKIKLERIGEASLEKARGAEVIPKETTFEQIREIFHPNSQGQSLITNCLSFVTTLLIPLHVLARF